MTVRTKEIPFVRRILLQEKINAGEPIQGLEGYVPAQTKCCTGGATHYLPVRVEGIKLGDCEFSVIVAPLSKEALCFEETFTINPKSFFQSKEEIRSHLAYLEQLRGYEHAMAPFKYNNGTRLERRRRFETAYQESNNATLKAEIDAESSDVGGRSKLDPKLIGDFYKSLMMDKFFPGREGFDPDVDTDEDDYAE